MSETRAKGPLPIYIAKGARVYVSGLLSLAIPFYLDTLGYSLLFQGIALSAILGGGAVSNLALTYFDRRISRRRTLQLFSLLMMASGIVFAYSTSPLPLLAACLIGNISTTGTEAGPFQSVEAGVLPDLVPTKGAVRAFGKYNLIGYTAAAAGALTAVALGLSGGDPGAYKLLFIGFALVGVLLFVLYGMLGEMGGRGSARPGLGSLSPKARRDVFVLSGLFSVDAFGGTFVSQYLLSTWFRIAYGLPLESLGVIFAVAQVVSAGSTYAAAIVAERLGNLRTMVYTHILSNLFLVSIALSGSLPFSLGFFFLRQSFSQMDVPTRQALMSEMFVSEERVVAYAITNTVRTGGAFSGGPVAAGLLALGLVSGLIYTAGITKTAYDIAIYSVYGKKYR